MRFQRESFVFKFLYGVDAGVILNPVAHCTVSTVRQIRVFIVPMHQFFH